ncbi:MAG: 1-(5-phosphoribosyl)-5-[(5-phosphoribosylamino)methylideneamino]imidazole-4-carboxamide isomerase [Leptospiraceae bacterium]|nr:1-(5-phosphoribosyl)-5-[(5-phosphoribosylamino)methylideneamino]imidazole-4-carboxamide isomerase [Leptospiraceae bacterium]MCK6382545.1 1-(5-phosphoribosyl)-5-[(5-phosphoribosylamino)methylideneamino]imidazole-4-carboxamide isomerase [Leptospiraceae bacterium]NUM41588.1 1-(5-phosphoribosyl)-5-[(5-phosphoribosylamino)methylideneamino]imidazole-4-carboxamide isomerase [Leptospiraceae bacterium]
MIIIPAIDLLNNEAVRLFKGDYNQKTVYSKEPWELVRIFERGGAELIHLIDLNGARNENDINRQSIEKIRKVSNAQIEIGGGIRNIEKIKFYDSVGMNRFIIGTAAVTNPEFIDEALRLFGPDKIVVGVDAKDGIVKISGWQEDSRVHYNDLLKRLASQGVTQIIYTDIAQDGTMSGPNFESYREILSNFHFQLIASGGISSVKDILKLASIKEKTSLYGIITGKAIYEGKLNLEEAIANTKNS